MSTTADYRSSYVPKGSTKSVTTFPSRKPSLSCGSYIEHVGNRPGLVVSRTTGCTYHTHGFTTCPLIGNDHAPYHGRPVAKPTITATKSTGSLSETGYYFEPIVRCVTEYPFYSGAFHLGSCTDKYHLYYRNSPGQYVVSSEWARALQCGVFMTEVNYADSTIHYCSLGTDCLRTTTVDRISKRAIYNAAVYSTLYRFRPKIARYKIT